ncbi:copper resistance D family protein [Pseudonocardia sp. WMMC193]|uniref:copper resistance D family protein n=1 Tax=Pseudonocardia sp. WMMC193 TaxID=2911965 RepID=UPI001F00CFC2|nr:CopD family protein [Pseudonocardia sp. WMMC193]MCF7551888.1 CopD family protein [Pseudonocardia sp. WMMC193]
MGAPTAARSTERFLPLVWALIAVGVALAAGALVAAGGVTLAATGARGLTDAVAVACVGLGLVTVLVPTSARDAAGLAVIRRGDRWTVPAAGLWLVAVLVSAVLRSAEAFGVSPAALTGGQVVAFGTRVAAGRGILLTALCALVVLGCAIARLRAPESVPGRVVLVAALLGALTPGVTGHTGTSPDHQFAVVTVALHVGAAALWVGGLAVLLVLIAPHRRLREKAIPRFSRIATVCVVGTGLTGIANAVLRLPTLGALVTSGYGALLLTKTGLIVLLALLGALARGRLQRGTLPVLRWAGIEVTVMAVTIGVAAALSQTAP